MTEERMKKKSTMRDPIGHRIRARIAEVRGLLPVIIDMKEMPQKVRLIHVKTMEKPEQKEGRKGEYTPQDYYVVIRGNAGQEQIDVVPLTLGEAAPLDEWAVRLLPGEPGSGQQKAV